MLTICIPCHLTSKHDLGPRFEHCLGQYIPCDSVKVDIAMLAVYKGVYRVIRQHLLVNAYGDERQFEVHHCSFGNDCLASARHTSDIIHLDSPV